MDLKLKNKTIEINSRPGIEYTEVDFLKLKKIINLVDSYNLDLEMKIPYRECVDYTKYFLENKSVEIIDTSNLYVSRWDFNVGSFENLFKESNRLVDNMVNINNKEEFQEFLLSDFGELIQVDIIKGTNEYIISSDGNHRSILAHLFKIPKVKVIVNYYTDDIKIKERNDKVLDEILKKEKESIKGQLRLKLESDIDLNKLTNEEIQLILLNHNLSVDKKNKIIPFSKARLFEFINSEYFSKVAYYGTSFFTFILTEDFGINALEILELDYDKLDELFKNS